MGAYCSNKKHRHRIFITHFTHGAFGNRSTTCQIATPPGSPTHKYFFFVNRSPDILIENRGVLTFFFKRKMEKWKKGARVFCYGERGPFLIRKWKKKEKENTPKFFVPILYGKKKVRHLLPPLISPLPHTKKMQCASNRVFIFSRFSMTT